VVVTVVVAVGVTVVVTVVVVDEEANEGTIVKISSNETTAVIIMVCFMAIVTVFMFLSLYRYPSSSLAIKYQGKRELTRSDHLQQLYYDVCDVNLARARKRC
jgi:heme/copper-type cytochrome/quinol oxidase subunit 2